MDLSAWAQARKRLYDTSVFRQVDIQAVPIEEVSAGNPSTGEQPVRARVTLDEWPPLRIRYGLEIDDERKPASETTVRPGVAADLTYRNMFGRAASTGLALRWAKDFEAARGFFSKPSFFGLPLTSSLFLSRSRENIGGSSDLPFVTDESEFTAEQRFRAGRRLQVAYSYSFQRNHTFDLNADPDDPFAFDLTVGIAVTKLSTRGTIWRMRRAACSCHRRSSTAAARWVRTCGFRSISSRATTIVRSDRALCSRRPDVWDWPLDSARN